MIRFAVRPRLTVGKLMIVVAIFALFFGGGLWVARLWPRHIEAERNAVSATNASLQAGLP